MRITKILGNFGESALSIFRVIDVSYWQKDIAKSISLSMLIKNIYFMGSATPFYGCYILSHKSNMLFLFFEAEYKNVAKLTTDIVELFRLRYETLSIEFSEVWVFVLRTHCALSQLRYRLMRVAITYNSHWI